MRIHSSLRLGLRNGPRPAALLARRPPIFAGLVATFVATFLAAFFGAFLAATESHAIDAALTLEGATTGPIPGDNVQQGREGTIAVLGYAGATFTPTTTGGLPSGSPECRRLTIRKRIDPATPLLISAWSNLETISRFELRFYRPNSSGVTQTYFTIELANARIVSISQAGGEADAQPTEQVSFVFAAAQYTFVTGSITTSYSCGAGPA